MFKTECHIFSIKVTFFKRVHGVKFKLNGKRVILSGAAIIFWNIVRCTSLMGQPSQLGKL